MFCRKQDRELFYIISSSQSWDILTHCVVSTPSTLQPLCPKSGVLREKADSSERADGEATGNFRILSLYHTDPICPILNFGQLIVPCSWACPSCATEAMLRDVAHLGPAAVRTGSRGCVSICVALSVVLRGKCQSVLHGKLSPKTQSRSNTMKERQPGSRYLQTRPSCLSGTVAQIDGGWAERRNGSISTVPRPLGLGSGDQSCASGTLHSAPQSA